MFAKNADHRKADTKRGDHGAFPGGRTRLPRLSRAGVRKTTGESSTNQEPDVLVVNGGFHKTATAMMDGKNAHRIAAPGDDTGFGRYYSAESLFENHRETEVKTTSDGPYGVLGLTRQASWEQIRRAHRSLVSSLHPDRFVGEEAAVIEHAERGVRDVNEAFAEIRRQRSVR